MTAVAPHLTAFLREHLPKERRASPHTCEAYADSFRILLGFAAHRLGTRPCRLEVEQLDAPLILAFLEHIEAARGNSARTRNARLAAVNAFFRFLEYRLPACLDQARRIHTIPMKKTDEALVGYLTREELQVCSMHPIRALLRAFATKPCSTSPLRPDCESRNSSASGWISSISQRSPASMCWERGGGNAYCHCGRKRPPR